MALTIGDLLVNLVVGNDAGLRAQVVSATTAAGTAGGTAASKSFADRFKAGLTTQNIGRGFMQGLGLGAGLGAVTAVAAAVGTVTQAVEGSIDAARGWESAMAGVSKTLDTTGLSSAEAADALADIEDGLRKMAEEIPVPVEQLAALAEAGGALGIARDDLLEFTRTAALLGTTTNLAASDAATALGKIGAVLPFTRDEYSRFAATLVDLGNKGASTESEIVAMAQNMAGAASLIGLSKAQLLGWASALANVGEEAEAGGSSFQRFALSINAIVGGSTELERAAQTAGIGVDQLVESILSGADGQRAMAEATGVTVKRLKELVGTRQDLDTLAQLAGTTASAFGELWSQDASRALQQVVNGLGQMDSQTRQATLAALDFKDIRITRALLSLSSNLDNVNSALEVAPGAWQANSAAMDEAEKRFETTDSKIAFVQNRLHNLAIDFGQAMIEAGNAAFEVIDAIAKAAHDAWRLAHPDLAEIEEIREQVRELARENGINEDAAVASFDAQTRAAQQTVDTQRQLAALQADLRSMEFGQVQQALDAVNQGLSITTGGFEDLIARVEAMNSPEATAALKAMRTGMALTQEQTRALGVAISQVRDDSIVILTESLRDLAVESGRPLLDVLTDARFRMQELGVETDNLDVLINGLRTSYGLTGPTVEEAAARTAKATEAFMNTLRELASSPAAQQQGRAFWTLGRDLMTQVGEGMQDGSAHVDDLIGDAVEGLGTIVKGALDAALADIADRRAWFEAGTGFVFDLTGGVRQGVKDSEPELKGAVSELRKLLRFDWDSEAAYAMGREFGNAVARGLRSSDPEIQERAKEATLGALVAMDRAGRTGPKAADAIGTMLARLYASGLTRGEVEARLAGEGVNLTTLEAIARKAGWHSGGEGQGSAWYKGVVDGATPSGDALKRANARALRELSKTAGWKGGGSNLGEAWVDGLVAALNTANGDDGRISLALSRISRKFVGSSPPPEGPLRHVDVGGFNVGTSWHDEFLRGIAVSDRDITEAIGLGSLGDPLASLNLTSMSSVAQTVRVTGAEDLQDVSLSGHSTLDVRHTITPEGAAALRSAGYKEGEVAALLADAGRLSGLRRTGPRRD